MVILAIGHMVVSFPGNTKSGFEDSIRGAIKANITAPRMSESSRNEAPYHGNREPYRARLRSSPQEAPIPCSET